MDTLTTIKDESGRPVAVAVPWRLYEVAKAEIEASLERARANVEEEAEDAYDLECGLRAQAEDDPAHRLPGPVVFAIVNDGANPLRTVRKHRGLTQEALAKAAGLSAGYIRHIEAGRQTPSRKALKAIAEALKTDPEFLAAD